MKKIFFVLLNIILCACSYSTPASQNNELSVQDSQKIIVSGNDIQSVELTNEEREIFTMQSLDHNFKSEAMNFLPSKFILGPHTREYNIVLEVNYDDSIHKKITMMTLPADDNNQEFYCNFNDFVIYTVKADHQKIEEKETFDIKELNPTKKQIIETSTNGLQDLKIKIDGEIEHEKIESSYLFTYVENFFIYEGEQEDQNNRRHIVYKLYLEAVS